MEFRACCEPRLSSLRRNDIGVASSLVFSGGLARRFFAGAGFANGRPFGGSTGTLLGHFFTHFGLRLGLSFCFGLSLLRVGFGFSSGFALGFGDFCFSLFLSGLSLGFQLLLSSLELALIHFGTAFQPALLERFMGSRQISLGTLSQGCPQVCQLSLVRLLNGFNPRQSFGYGETGYGLYPLRARFFCSFRRSSNGISGGFHRAFIRCSSRARRLGSRISGFFTSGCYFFCLGINVR